MTSSAPLDDLARGDSPTSSPDLVRLLTFVTSFFVGGTERQVANLSRAIDLTRFDLRFACLIRRGEFLARTVRPDSDVEEYRVRNLYGVRSVEERWRLFRSLKAQDVHIIHAYNFYANAFAVPAARLAGTPVVIASIRDQGDHITRNQNRVQKVVCGMAHCVVTNAEAVRRQLIGEGYSPTKLQVIHNGVAIPDNLQPETRGRLRQELGLPPDAPLVAAICRLAPCKGVQFFLEAAAHLAPRWPDVRFLVVGDGPCRADLERTASRLGLSGRLVFAGSRSDIPEILSDLRVCVLPSLYEGLPNILLESMAMGIPVVATRVGGTPEGVDDGVTGILVPPRDPGSLARAVEHLLQDPEAGRRMGMAGRERVIARFSIERMVRATESLYTDLLQQRRVRVSAPPVRAAAPQAMSGTTRPMELDR
jgi:glycosyltransferase involved in cell wall biosynthesis